MNTDSPIKIAISFFKILKQKMCKKKVWTNIFMCIRMKRIILSRFMAWVRLPAKLIQIPSIWRIHRDLSVGSGYLLMSLLKRTPWDLHKKTQNKNKNIFIMQFVVVYMATTNYFHLNYVLSNRLIFTWMQIHWVECSDTTAQSAISTNMPCNEQWTWNLKKRRTFLYIHVLVCEAAHGLNWNRAWW